MISALLYLQWNSVRNRLVARFKRLKQPKYLVGAIVGGAYFYFYFLNPFYFGHHRSKATVSADDRALYEMIGAVVLFVVVASGWIFPRERSALTFTEAEVAFLFPAPITRRGLVRFKLLRSQTAILFGAIFLALISRRFGGGSGWIHAAGWWLVLSVLNLHFLGASFARTLLMDRGITNWWRRIIIVLALAALAVATVLWARQAIPGASTNDFQNLSKIEEYGRQVMSSGPLPYLLAPFRYMVRPYFAPDWGTFFMVVWPAIGLLVLHYLWVTTSDVAFEEGSLEASKKQAERVAAMRAGNWRLARKQTKPVRAPFKLASTGFPPVALLWKNLMSAGRAFTARAWIWLAAIAIGVGINLRHKSGEPVTYAIAVFAGFFGMWLLLFGPNIVRYDFRQDLPMADMLKTFPMTGWQLAFGELLAPAAILTGVQWCLLIIAAGCLPKQMDRLDRPELLAMTCGVALNLPFLNLIGLLIPNAAVLLFPAWFQLGKSGPQGIEATGQRLIFMLGQMVVLILALVPAGGIGGLTFLVLESFVASWIAVAVSALLTAAILALETTVGLKLLGELFERFDLSGELTG